MAVLGLASDESAKWAGDSHDAEDYAIYPENELAVRVFMSMRTQWQWTGGMEPRRCGLNHGVFPLHMEKERVPKKRRFDVMADVQIMEEAALSVWNST